MPDRLVLDQVALTDAGPTLSLRLASGRALSVVGRANSGKSRFLATITQPELAARGAISLLGSVFRASGSDPGRRTKPQTLASVPASNGNDRAAQALSATGLWNVRKNALADLSADQRRAAMLLPVLVSSCDVLVIDGLLDPLDPWTLHSVIQLLRMRMSQGQSLCVATNRPDIAAQTDVLVVLEGRNVRFAGSPEELLRAATVTRLEVHSENHEAVRAIAEPFEVTVSEEEGALRLEAAEGQQLAAKLLLEGYGNVKFILLREPTIEDALRSLL